jgi:CxC2 like cysteine cluster associated with KDZ transposases
MPVPGSQKMPVFDDNEEPLDTGAGEEDVNDDEEDDDDEDDELDDVENLNPYLDTYPSAYAGSSINAGSSAIPIPGSGPQTGAYLRVVHSNGLHHIAMVSCHCRGDDELPLDLFAAHLIPASLKRIKTVFTAQVLDMFRLSNLELKASAYQFYQLLRRLTRPMAPAEVDNLYREFRRMTRLWRWMKKLKWAGYAGSTKPVNDVSTGELAIYCPACPQPGINIPEDWMKDPARWVYKRIFVADGNFKADHVRQKHEAGDVWLSEGSGMIPRRQEYLSFLASAIERLTVSVHNYYTGKMPGPGPGPVPVASICFRTYN